MHLLCLPPQVWQQKPGMYNHGVPYAVKVGPVLSSTTARDSQAAVYLCSTDALSCAHVVDCDCERSAAAAAAVPHLVHHERCWQALGLERLPHCL
jgi:hypothetical protein